MCEKCKNICSKMSNVPVCKISVILIWMQSLLCIDLKFYGNVCCRHRDSDARTAAHKRAGCHTTEGRFTCIACQLVSCSGSSWLMNTCSPGARCSVACWSSRRARKYVLNVLLFAGSRVAPGYPWMRSLHRMDDSTRRSTLLQNHICYMLTVWLCDHSRAEAV